MNVQAQVDQEADGNIGFRNRGLNAHWDTWSLARGWMLGLMFSFLIFLGLLMLAAKAFLASKTAPTVLRVEPNRNISVQLRFDSPWKLNQAAPSSLVVYDQNTRVVKKYEREDLLTPIALPSLAGSSLTLKGTFFICKEQNSEVCRMERRKIQLQSAAPEEVAAVSDVASSPIAVDIFLGKGLN